MTGKLVCVTGASGFIASWLVKLLLDRGYVVRATVRDLADPAKTKHLCALEGANERLQLVKANLLEMDSFDAAVDSCEAVFHTASPVIMNGYKDPEAEIVDPAVKGTINVLNACAKTSSVKRVVITSSMAAVVHNGRPRNTDVLIDETWFSDPEFCKQTQAWYQVSKTLAEETAWKMAKEKGLDVVTINPAVVIGHLLQPTLNGSCTEILQLMNGSSTFPNQTWAWVSVKDVAEAHILAFEVPSANGRYLLAEKVAHFSEIVKILRELYPGCSLPTKCVDDKPFVPTFQVSKEKVENLGLKYTPIEKALRDTVESLKEKKMLHLESSL